MSVRDTGVRGQSRRPVSVLVVVYVPDGSVLLLRRSRPFDFWQSVTGSLGADETHAEAASRELEEETGLCDEGELSFSGTARTFEIDARWAHRYPRGVTQNVEYEWRYRLPGTRDVTLNPMEHSEFKWLPVDEAIDLVWSWTNREALTGLRDAL
ncbi:MAG: dihydroneopterin triphosphate diphosphatase [Woeseiaceae bacterium]